MKQSCARTWAPTNDQQISCRPTFAAHDLPSLLADCAIGIFPSHVEGFGLAVLEQLAAGLPTIAYDVPGPRQILQTQSAGDCLPRCETRLLSPPVLRKSFLSPVAEYEKLSADCVEIARRYRWKEIAENTIKHYRGALDSLGPSTDRSTT